jgi:hypothetical protein
LVGNAGSDSADYSAYVAAVSVDLDGEPGDDGMSGEGDSVAADVENVLGGAGDDFLTGNDGENALTGSGGNDALVGGAAFDRLSGEEGDDTIDSRDGSRDDVTCGAGVDSVAGDVDDAVQPDCETVQRNALPAPGSPSAPGSPPTVRPSPVGLAVRVTSAKRRKLRTALARGVRVSIRCSALCTVRLELRFDAGTARRLRVPRVAGVAVRRLAANRRATVVIRLTPQARRTLRARRSIVLRLQATALGTRGDITRAGSRRIVLSR